MDNEINHGIVIIWGETPDPFENPTEETIKEHNLSTEDLQQLDILIKRIGEYYDVMRIKLYSKYFKIFIIKYIDFLNLHLSNNNVQAVLINPNNGNIMINNNNPGDAVMFANDSNFIKFLNDNHDLLFKLYLTSVKGSITVIVVRDEFGKEYFQYLNKNIQNFYITTIKVQDRSKLVRLSTLYQFIYLEQIYLCFQLFTDFDFIKIPNNKIKKINLCNNKITQISDVVLDFLEELDLSSNNIEKIDNIKDFVNLKNVNISYNKINIIPDLSALTNLNVLDLSNNNITDISGIKNLENITELKLAGNKINDISNLSNLISIKKLDLDYNNVTNLNALKKLVNITHLYMNNNNIEDISGLSDLTNITGLELGNNYIRNIQCLENLRKLKSLGLKNNKFKDISVIGKLTSLDILDLNNNDITDYPEDIDSFLSIKILHCDFLKNGEFLNKQSKIPVSRKVAEFLKDKIITKYEKDIWQGGKNIINLSSVLNNYVPYYLTTIYIIDTNISIIEGLDKCFYLKRLDLRNSNITKISGLETVTTLELLDISRNHISDISGLETLVNLKELDLSNNEINEITGLENLKELRKLYLNDNNITTIAGMINLPKFKKIKLSNNENNENNEITGLENLHSLEILDLYNNEIQDISGLALLSAESLTYLDLSNNCIKHITGLENFHNLVDLCLNDNYISEITGLDNCGKLEILNIKNNKIKKISGIFNLANLLQLHITKNKINELPDELTKLVKLANFTYDEDKIQINLKFLEYLRTRIDLKNYNKDIKLTYKLLDEIPAQDKPYYIESADFSENKITKISSLHNWFSLKCLKLGKNNIKEIIGLENLANLEDLSLYGNQIEVISGLETLTKLKSLSLFNNRISKISGLDTLTELTELNLSGNLIDNITNIDKLTKLSRLVISHNKITEITGLNTLSKLKSLELYYCKISKISGLDNLTELTDLLLFNNTISEITGLDNLTNLSILNLCHNKITAISGLDNLSKLKSLYLDNNNITEIKNINNLESLTTLYINYNPIRFIPLSVMRLKLLTVLQYPDRIILDISIKRFLNRFNKIKNGNLFTNDVDVHEVAITKSVKESIYNIVECEQMKYGDVIDEINSDKILTNDCKMHIHRFINIHDVHSELNLSFKQILVAVWTAIKQNNQADAIKMILCDAMEEASGVCFTGKISRLINVLTSFDDRVAIEPEDCDIISNVIIKVQKEFKDADKAKADARKRLAKIGYSNDVIETWVEHM